MLYPKLFSQESVCACVCVCVYIYPKSCVYKRYRCLKLDQGFPAKQKPSYFRYITSYPQKAQAKMLL